MVKKYSVVFFLLFVCTLGAVSAASDIRAVLPFLGETQYAKLEAGEIVNGESVNGEPITPYFVDGSEAFARAQIAQGLEDGFSIAAVSYIPYGPKLLAMNDAERQLAIFNKIRAISTQEGLIYISWRAGNKPKVLIEKSAYMETEKDLNKLLPDPVATTFPLSAQSYVFQRDSSFGGNRYLHTYSNSDKEIFVSIQNISAMKVFGLFTAVPKGNLSINMGTYLLDEGVLLTALTTIEGRDPEVSVLGYKVDLPSAFKRRITALQNWFVAQLATIEME
ncbi:DUF6675 family protein [Sphaerochaeta sp. PS]|uniref:DUF6675 family protein n=1 Tax=Sphaerochaeta sp. PS TaxID=3076336 RepID=UPI0028A55AF5|nr:DUF6675 family protein [Sphaerochaeta sp. PS]MDT4761986.1 DUF6675 family protein [Sphaerochaeta sp. PS]